MDFKKENTAADFEPMPTLGKCVEEIRIRDDTGTYRVIYTVRLLDALYIAHDLTE